MIMKRKYGLAVLIVGLMLCLAVSVQAAPKSQGNTAPGGPPEHIAEEGVYIVINKSAHNLTVYTNGVPQYVFAVGTGRRKELTPSGTFKIVTKVYQPWYIRKQIPGGHPTNPLGTRWLGLNIPGTGGYTYGIHGTNRPWSIGGNVSSGCVRMYNKDVEWLYRHIPIGTMVLIKEK